MAELLPIFWVLALTLSLVMLALKISPITLSSRGRPFVRRKTGTCGTRAHGRARHPALSPTRYSLIRKCETAYCLSIADILGSFIMLNDSQEVVIA